jgi:hypothetical protein
MNSIFLFCKVPHVQLQDVRHQSVEHVKASRLLNLDSSTPMIDYIKDRCQNLVHALHVFYLGVEPSENKEDARHVIVSIGVEYLIRLGQPFGAAFPANQLVFFASGGCEEWYGEGFSRP